MFINLILKSLEILAENKKPQKKKILELFENLFLVIKLLVVWKLNLRISI